VEKMPILFLGHGSPMNAIEENEFVNGWRDIGRSIPKPVAVLCVSAHRETRGTFVTAMEKPSTCRYQPLNIIFLYYMFWPLRKKMRR